MGALKDKLLETAVRPTVVLDCVTLVDNEVAARSGITGAIIKTGYKAFKAVKPTIVKDAVDHLLDDFVDVLDKYYDRFKAAGAVSFETWVKPKDAELADDLLKVTDNIMNKSDKTALKKIYGGLRKIAEKNVAQAVPATARLIEKHMR
jgi:hypothetical protein